MQDPSPREPQSRVATLASAIEGAVGLAQALVVSRRAIDLAGLDNQVGLLCAQALDLPPEQGRAIRPALERLADALDALDAALAAAA